MCAYRIVIASEAWPKISAGRAQIHAHHQLPGEVVAAVMEPEWGSQPRGLHGGLEASAGTSLRPEAALARARAADQHIVDALAHRDLSAPAGLSDLEPEHTTREVHPIPRQSRKSPMRSGRSSAGALPEGHHLAAHPEKLTLERLAYGP